MADLRTLRVCHSSELPGLLERDKNYIYFVYDKLLLYSGQNMLTENFSIASEIPEEQLLGMIYILNTDGSVHRKTEYVDKVIANIESEEQIELLKKAGTQFYINNNYRYLDSQQRTLTLPYNDGTYELSSSARKEDVFDNNTILKFNEKTNRFELYGDSSEEFIDFSKPFRGRETNSVKVKVDGPRIFANIKVSKTPGNLLKETSDGLYVKPTNLVDRETFDQWSYFVNDFKSHAQDVLDKITAEIKDVSDLVTPEAISEEIMEQLKTKYITIETALANYQEVVDSLDGIENELIEFASTNIALARTALINTLENNTKWKDVDDSSKTYTHEVDYYKKAEEYLYPDGDV